MKCILTAMVFLISFPALSKCGFELFVSTINYVASDVNPVTAQNLELYRKEGGSSCGHFAIGFSRGNAGSYNRIATNSMNGATLSYNLYKTNSAETPLRSLKDAHSHSQILNGTIGKKETKNLNYFFKLLSSNSSNVLRAGLYSDTVLVEAGRDEDDLEDSEREVRVPLPIRIVVPTNISLSLVDSGADHNPTSTSKILDFGELSLNQELGFDVRVVSNAGYALSVSSVNNQKLAVEPNSLGIEGQIGYDFYARNSLKNLSSSSSSPVLIDSRTGSTPIQGVSVPIRVVIKSVDNKISGIYKDYVTFTISATE